MSNRCFAVERNKGTVSVREALVLVAEEIDRSKIRGFRPTTTRQLVNEMKYSPDVRGLSATWEWSYAAEAHLSVSFDMVQMALPKVQVNWPATSRSPVEGQVSLQLYRRVVNLACRLEVMLQRLKIRPEGR